tara:strand:+ start:1632 stop:2090 length:459 start_codon:yes stop_codon:yes gene_type:complete
MSEFNYKDFLKNSSFLNEAEEKEEDKVSEDRIEKAIKAVLKKEGGAAGLDPIKDAVKALDVDKDFDLEKTIKDIPSVETHKDGDIIDTDGLKEEEENIEEAEESSLSREKKMVMKLLLGKMQDIENANPEELTRDFLIKTKKMIDDLMMSDF